MDSSCLSCAAPLGRVETEKSGRMNEVHCPPSETDVEKAVHTPCTHRHSPDDKTIPTRPGGARRLWRKTGRPKRSGRTDDRLSLRPRLSPQLRAARRTTLATGSTPSRDRGCRK